MTPLLKFYSCFVSVSLKGSVPSSYLSEGGHWSLVDQSLRRLFSKRKCCLSWKTFSISCPLSCLLTLSFTLKSLPETHHSLWWWVSSLGKVFPLMILKTRVASRTDPHEGYLEISLRWWWWSFLVSLRRESSHWRCLKESSSRRETSCIILGANGRVSSFFGDWHEIWGIIHRSFFEENPEKTMQSTAKRGRQAINNIKKRKTASKASNKINICSLCWSISFVVAKAHFRWQIQPKKVDILFEKTQFNSLIELKRTWASS